VAWLLGKISDNDTHILLLFQVPLLTELFNHSMSAGQFLSIFKEALITPAVKKPGLVVTNVAQQLHEYLKVRWNLLPPLQSVFYRNSCSTCLV